MCCIVAHDEESGNHGRHQHRAGELYIPEIAPNGTSGKAGEDDQINRKVEHSSRRISVREALGFLFCERHSNSRSRISGRRSESAMA